MSQMGVIAECLTGRTHLPPRCVPSTVWPGPVPSASLGLFYSRVDFHSHFIDEGMETQGKWLTQNRQSVIGERGLPAQSSRCGRCEVGFGGGPCPQWLLSAVIKPEVLGPGTGLISSFEMPSRHSPLGHLIYYASGG